MIEIDGDPHTEQVEYDQARTKWLEGPGYHVIRFSNRDVFRRLEAVLEAILRESRRQKVPTPG